MGRHPALCLSRLRIREEAEVPYGAAGADSIKFRTNDMWPVGNGVSVFLDSVRSSDMFFF